MSHDASGTGSNASGQGATAFTPSPTTAKKEPKSKTFDLRVIADAFLGKTSFWLTTLPAEQFVVVVDPFGARKLAQLKDGNIVAYISDDVVTSMTHKFLVEHGIAFKKSLKDFSPRDLKTVKDFILTSSSPILETDIVPIAVKSDERLTYHRLPFDLDSTAPCPTFDEIFQRMTNADAIKAWIGSLFDFKSSREQYPVLYGEGQNSKGRLLEYLMWQFGDAAMAGPSGDGGTARYFNATVYNKRLVCYGECDKHGFVTSEVMKTITGNDFVLCDDKNVKLFKGRAICKFFFATNVIPNLKNILSHRRRILYAEIGPIAGRLIMPARYDAMLQAESHAFLSACWRKYEELTDSGAGPIPTDDAVYQRAVEVNEAEFQEIVDRSLEVHEDKYIYGKEIGKLLHDYGVPSVAKKPFVQFLKQKYGVEYKNHRDKHNGGKQICAYWGIGAKGAIVAEQRTEGHSGLY